VLVAHDQVLVPLAWTPQLQQEFERQQAALQEEAFQMGLSSAGVTPLPPLPPLPPLQTLQALQSQPPPPSPLPADSSAMYDPFEAVALQHTGSDSGVEFS
jgi:hypothetical protein